MTEGTSQGLFVVVAIVIFGIFVAISHSVFGSSLREPLVNMFDSAVENPTYAVNKVKPFEYFDMNNLVRWASDTWENEPDENRILISSSDNYTGGLYIPSTYFDDYKTYTVQFEITKLSGSIEGLGGHLATATNAEVYINGVEEPEVWRDNTDVRDINNWAKGVVYPNNSEKNTVSITFTIDHTSENRANTLYIQPNRNNGGDSGSFYIEKGLAYEVLIENIRIQEHR